MLLGSTSCADSREQPRATSSAGTLAGNGALEAAITAVGATQAPLRAAVTAVTDSRSALDAADTACATGSVPKARKARVAATAARGPGRTALAALPQRARAYRAALDRLGVAGSGLTSTQRAALTAVARDGAAEAASDEALGSQVSASQDTYTELDRSQSRWLDRAAAGWYRTQAEAAAAYGVFLAPQQQSLARARTALQQADAVVLAAVRRQQRTLATADRALESLRGTG